MRCRLISTRPKNFMHWNHFNRVLGGDRISILAVFRILLGTSIVRCVCYVSCKCRTQIIMISKASTLVICSSLFRHEWIYVHSLGKPSPFIFIFLHFFFNVRYIFQNVIYYSLFMQLLNIFLIHNSTALFIAMRFWESLVGVSLFYVYLYILKFAQLLINFHFLYKLLICNTRSRFWNIRSLFRIKSLLLKCIYCDLMYVLSSNSVFYCYLSIESLFWVISIAYRWRYYNGLEP